MGHVLCDPGAFFSCSIIPPSRSAVKWASHHAASRLAEFPFLILHTQTHPFLITPHSYSYPLPSDPLVLLLHACGRSCDGRSRWPLAKGKANGFLSAASHFGRPRALSWRNLRSLACGVRRVAAACCCALRWRWQMAL